MGNLCVLGSPESCRSLGRSCQPHDRPLVKQTHLFDPVVVFVQEKSSFTLGLIQLVISNWIRLHCLFLLAAPAPLNYSKSTCQEPLMSPRRSSSYSETETGWWGRGHVLKPPDHRELNLYRSTGRLRFPNLQTTAADSDLDERVTKIDGVVFFDSISSSESVPLAAGSGERIWIPIKMMEEFLVWQPHTAGSCFTIKV